MRARVWAAWLLALAVAMPGCIIGTWPTPEWTPGGGDGGSLGKEQCDGVDDDADGGVDEGCPCKPGEARGCIAVSQDGCGFGIQTCRSGYWSACGELQPPYVPARTPAVGITRVDPVALQLGVAQELTVEVSVTTACDGIYAAPAKVRLTAATPPMTVQRIAADDGAGGDAAAWDGVITTTLPDAFGPGVPAQPLALTASTLLGGHEKTAATTVALEAP